MSTVSPSQNMAQPNQQNDSYDPSLTPMKRKRGRPRKDRHPRKDEVSGSEPNKRSKECTVLQGPSSNDGLVGQEVSCSFIGVFDAGYLLTVQVGSSGPILTGMVFDPRLSIPVSAENDIAPHLPMLGRNGFSPSVEEGFINQGADSSQAGIAQKTELTQHIQTKESPTTSSFTSHVQTDLQLNMVEVTPSRSSHVPEPQHIPKTSKVFLEGAATETSDQNPLTSSYHPQSQAKSEHTPISAGLSDISMEAPASKPSNDYNPSVLSMVTSSEVSKPSNVSDPPEAPEAMTLASSEPLSIPKEAPSSTTESSLDVSNEVLFDISKPSDISKEAHSAVFEPSEASATTQKITLDEHESSVVYGDGGFEPTQVLQHQTLKTGDLAIEILSTEKSSQRTEELSEDLKVDESLGDSHSPGLSTSSG